MRYKTVPSDCRRCQRDSTVTFSSVHPSRYRGDLVSTTRAIASPTASKNGSANSS